MKSAQIQGAIGDREPNDFYPTPDRATIALLERIALSGTVWEPACGDGAISKLLPPNTISTDLIDRGFGVGGVDFLKTEKQVDWIITNPPYGIATDFVAHAIKCSKNTAMLLKIQFLEGAKRHRKIFRDNPPSRVLVFSERLNINKGGSENGNKTMFCFAWFLWEDGVKGTNIEWIAQSTQATPPPPSSGHATKGDDCPAVGCAGIVIDGVCTGDGKHIVPATRPTATGLTEAEREAIVAFLDWFDRGNGPGGTYIHVVKFIDVLRRLAPKDAGGGK